MLPAVIADLLVAVHFGFILFVIFGGLLVLRWRWIAWLHVPAAVWGALIELVGGVCPLTPLENHFRRLAGEAGYTHGFIDEYIAPLVYPLGLTPHIQIWLGVGVIVINLIVYGLVARTVRQRR